MSGGGVAWRRKLCGGLIIAAWLGLVLLASGHGVTKVGGKPQGQRQLPLLAAAQLAPSSTSTAPAAPAGNPTAAMTSPADGSTASAGTAVTLAATLSTDLVTALQAGSGGSCYFLIGDDANSTTRGVLDLSARTCTGSWTFSYADTYSIAASVATPSGLTYGSAPITVTVSGGSNPRCTGQAGAPSSCVYRWTEVYYTSSNNTRYARVCSLDGGCQWQTTHTSWPQVTGKDYWINSTGQPLGDGNSSEAYLCLGSSPTDWTSYTSSHSFDTLLNRPETSATPIPAGTC